MALRVIKVKKTSPATGAALFPLPAPRPDLYQIAGRLAGITENKLGRDAFQPLALDRCVFLQLTGKAP